MEQEIKKPWHKKKWVWVVGVIVILYIIGSSSMDKTATSNESNVQAEQASVQAEKQYQQVFTFSGTGQKKSEPFTITGDRFKIAYDCKGDPSATLCQAFIFKVGSSLPQPFLNATQSVKDETIIYGKGEYYIDSNVIGNFTMTVYDYK